MRMLNPSLAVASFFGFLTAASCTLITDVDRTKIPTDAGPGTGGAAGDTGTGGTANEGGSAGGSEAGSDGGGKGGSGNNGGTGATGGTAGTDAGAGGNDAGSGGTGVQPSKVCSPATGRITIGLNTLIDASGSGFTLGDGVHDKVTFEFDWTDDNTTVTGDNVIPFSGTPTTAELAVLIADAINNSTSDLDITATTTAGGNGNGGAGGEGGNGGQAGAGEPATPQAETVELTNDRAGALGNVKITESIGNPNFKVSGMSGGEAVLCDTATACDDSAECDADRTCSSDHICE